jgi:uncharacterized protein (DUF58 family)
VSESVLSRYLDPEVLNRVADRRIEPRGLVMGSLAGAHKSPLHGFAVEFAGHREYVRGDDPKHIDWRVYFRREKYFIKQYEMETNFVCHLILDISASMRYGGGGEQKLSYASRMAAVLAHAIVRQSDKFSIATFDDRVRGVVPPAGSMAQLTRMAERLDESKAVEKTRMAECLTELCGSMRRREIVMIFSDFFTDLAPLETALQRMIYSRHQVVLFQVLHHDELHFDFSGRVKFLGLEAPEAILTQPDELRAGYLKALERFNARFADLAQRNRIERVLVDTRRPLAEILADYLSARGGVRAGG